MKYIDGQVETKRNSPRDPRETLTRLLELVAHRVAQKVKRKQVPPPDCRNKVPTDSQPGKSRNGL